LRVVAEPETALERDRSRWLRLTIYERVLIVVFLLTIPLTNPWVRGDGVGYYAYARSLLIERRLDFQKDWEHGNESFVMGRVDSTGHVLPSQYTRTGEIGNHWTIGPAILWAPFLIATHVAVVTADHMGAHIAADGFSLPYLVATAVATCVYGFLGIWISFHLARQYFPERWAFLATVGIWWATALPVYMYFNPSWSHAHSAFVVALFLWYWNRTRKSRTLSQWIILGAIAGLMIDVYTVNAVVLLVPLMESCGICWKAWPERQTRAVVRLFAYDVVFVLATLVAFLPTLVTRKVIFGSYLSFGYTERWFWNSPAFWKVCFSAEHGLFSWTPILILAVAGLFFLRRYDTKLGTYLPVLFLAYLYVIGCYENWAGLSSFGNRFFISLTPVFVLGLAAFVDTLARIWSEWRVKIFAVAATCVLVMWNLGLIYQWGTHLIPARGPIVWREAAYNQVAVVPVEAAQTVKNYLIRRGRLMQRIEEEDVKQLKSGND
jgi:hypothetical protein